MFVYICLLVSCAAVEENSLTAFLSQSRRFPLHQKCSSDRKIIKAKTISLALNTKSLLSSEILQASVTFEAFHTTQQFYFSALQFSLFHRFRSNLNLFIGEISWWS
jgi:hypothetical protein